MAGQITYISSSTIATAAMTSELASLASTSLVLASNTFTTGGNYLMAEVQFTANTYTGTTAGTSGVPLNNTGISVWFLRQIDGTNLEDGSASVTPARFPDVVLPLRSIAATTQRVVKRCLLPPGNFVPLLKNDFTGVTFSAATTATTLSILPLTYAY